jgi:MFS family permease
MSGPAAGHLCALLLNACAMGLFLEAHSAAELVRARVVQGLAIGAAITTLGAAILDADGVRGPLLNSITAFIGLTLGALGAAALATYAPLPEHLVYIILLVASLVLAAVIWLLPETVKKRPGALSSLLPHLHIPPAARTTLLRLTPVKHRDLGARRILPVADAVAGARRDRLCFADCRRLGGRNADGSRRGLGDDIP